MKKYMAISMTLGFCLTAGLANAQSGIDIFAGAGTATDTSSHSLIDTFSTGNPFTSPSLGGTFGKFGAGIMLNPYLGVNGEADLRLSQGAYAGLNYRPTLYDFNAVFLPTGRHSRVVPELQAGLGGMNMRFFYPSSYCDAFAGCSSSNNYIESSNHFQVHLSAGVRFYVTQHLFIKPQVDAHYVNNLFQFGSNWIPEYSGVIGWTFGER